MVRKQMWTACAAAGIGALSLHAYLARFEAEAAGGPPQRIVSLTRDLSPGEVVTQSALGERDLPEQYLEERHVAAADRERVMGLRATTLLRAGSSLLWTDLDVMQEGRSLSSLVSSGMRAFSVRDGASGFDGLLRPGDRVDVLFTARQEAQSHTQTLLENVLVLTVGGDLGRAGARATAESRVDGRSVTLSVSPEQAELLSQAEERGRLRLSLRNPEDLVTQSRPQRQAVAENSEGDRAR